MTSCLAAGRPLSTSKSCFAWDRGRPRLFALLAPNSRHLASNLGGSLGNSYTLHSVCSPGIRWAVQPKSYKLEW